jgi:hypothetical protein
MPFIILLLVLQVRPQDLVETLRSGTLEEREGAEAALRRSGPGAVEPLERAWRGTDPELRVRARRLLSDLGASVALIEDLRSDPVPGNARRARTLLLARKDEAGLGDRLLDATAGDDDQQAIQAACVLLRWGRGAAILERSPELLERAAAAFARSETRDYEWVATEVLLDLAATASDAHVERSFLRAFRGAPPRLLASNHEPTPMGRALSVARDRALPLPPSLLRHFLANLRHDEVWGNAYHAVRLVERHRAFLQPALARMVRDSDAQARQIALGLLLGLGLPELPEGSDDVLGEMLGRHPEALPRLLGYGETAVPVLVAHLGRADHRGRLEAALGLATVRSAEWGPRLAELARPHLEADGLRDNARAALEVLVRCGEAGVPVLKGALESPDEQAVACGAVGLAVMGRGEPLSRDARRKIHRLAARPWGQDEERAVVEALLVVDGLWEEVEARLRDSGSDGMSRAGLLRDWKGAQLRSGWLRLAR